MTYSTKSAQRPRYAVISDETGPHLDDCISFCVSEGLGAIEVRQVDGVAPLSLSDDQARHAARRIHDAGLAVAGIATPLLKWAAPDKAAAELGDQFGFDRAGRSDDELAMDAIRIADIFETKNLRIFSFLKHDAYIFDHLRPALDRLLEHAERHDKILLLENEPVCNVARMDELAETIAQYDTPRLQPLPDIGNSVSIGEFPSADLMATLMPTVTHVHFKDWSAAKGGYVPTGQGDVPLETYVGQLIAGAGARQLTFSFETHVPDDPLEATRASFHALRDVVDKHLSNA